MRHAPSPTEPNYILALIFEYDIAEADNNYPHRVTRLGMERAKVQIGWRLGNIRRCHRKTLRQRMHTSATTWLLGKKGGWRQSLNNTAANAATWAKGVS